MWHFGSGWCTTPPPRNWNLTKYECYRTKSFQDRSSSTFYNLPPLPVPPVPLSDSLPKQETGEFQFQMDMDIWTWTHPPPPLSSQKKWNACFWIMFNFWWSTGLVDGLEPYLLPFSSQKMKCLFLDYIQLLMISQAGWWTRTPSATPLQPKKMKCSFLDFVQLLMISQAGWWTQTPSATSLQPKNEMLVFGLHSTSDDQLGCLMDSNPICHPSPGKKMIIFGLHSTSDDWLGWLMDLNPIHHPSPVKKMKWSLLDYIQLLMIGQAGWWTQTPSATSLQPNKMKCLFLDYIQLLMMGQAGRWTRTLSATSLQPKNEMLIFGLHSTSDDQVGWSMDSNPICHPSPVKENK